MCLQTFTATLNQFQARTYVRRGMVVKGGGGGGGWGGVTPPLLNSVSRQDEWQDDGWMQGVRGAVH